MKILDAIRDNHCQKYCGLIEMNERDRIDCAKHHHEIYKRYLEAVELEHYENDIIKEFRWGKLL